LPARITIAVVSLCAVTAFDKFAAQKNMATGLISGFPVLASLFQAIYTGLFVPAYLYWPVGFGNLPTYLTSGLPKV